MIGADTLTTPGQARPPEQQYRDPAPTQAARAASPPPVPSARRLTLAAALGGPAAGWFGGYLAVFADSPLRVALAVALLGALPLLYLYVQVSGLLFLGLLWTRASDVAIWQHGLPSIALPSGCLLLLFSLARRLQQGERLSRRLMLPLLPAVPYALAVLLSPLWSLYPERSLDQGLELLKDLFIFWVLVDVLRDRRLLRGGVLAIVLAAALMSLPSLHQTVTRNYSWDYGGFAQGATMHIVGEIDSNRLGGPFNSPNYFALMLVVTVPLALALLRATHRPAARLACLGLLLTIVLTVLLTYSRGATLLMGLVLLAALPRHRLGLQHLVVAILLGTVVLVAAPARVWQRLETVLSPLREQSEVGLIVDDAVELRLTAQRVALEMFLDHPLLGVGAQNYPPRYQEYVRNLGVRGVANEFSPHNFYLETLAESGLLGLAGLGLAVLVPLLSLWQARRAADAAGADHDERELLVGLQWALLAYLVGSGFEAGAFPRYLWMLLALAVVAARPAPTPNRSNRAAETESALG